MEDTLDPLSERANRMTDAYNAGREMANGLRDEDSLRAVVSEVTIQADTLEDSNPNWHPAPDSFLGMIRLFIYREITGNSYRALAQYQELTDAFGLDHIPDDLCSLERGVIASTTMSSNS